VRFFLILYKLGEKREKLILSAYNRAEALKKFMEMEIGVVVEVKEVPKPLKFHFQEILEKFNNPIKNKPVKLEPYIALLDQLAIMLDAGLPLNLALKEVIKNEKDLMLKAIFSQIYNDIESGKGLYESAKGFKTQLGNISLSLFHLGEETGTLAQEISHLSQILQEILDNRRKFKKATRYPLFILVSMGVSFVVVTLMVVPQFESFFKETNMELPLPTKLLLGFKEIIVEYGGAILAGTIALIVTIWLAYKKSVQLRWWIDRGVLKVFILGKATYYAMLSRFFYIFKVLNDAGVPILEAILIANEIVENQYLKEKIEYIPLAIEEGKNLYQGFESAEVFEGMVVEMVKTGEIGGGLSKMLGKITKMYKERFDYIVDNITILIEPILIAVIALFVLTLALGIFLPMWNLSQMIG